MNDTIVDTPDPGGFSVGDRVKLVNAGLCKMDVGAQGVVRRVDVGDVFPVIVWFDVFGKATTVEESGRMGLPCCASDIVSVA